MRHLKLALTAAAALSVATPAVAEDVNIGILLGYTGPLETLAPPIGDAAKLALQHVNEQGGILGGEAKFTIGDSTCADATAAATAADRLINSDGVHAIVGAMCSGATISAANTAAIPAGVVMVSPSASSPAVTTVEDNDLLFRVGPSDAYQGEVVARMLLNKGINDIAITYVNNDYGKGFADALATAYEAGGGDVLISEAHEEGKSDYRAELGSLAASGSQNLIILAYASGSGQTILRQAIEAGDFVTYFGGDGMVADALVTGIDPAAVEGMLATRQGRLETEGTSVYEKLAKDAGLDPIASFGPQAYDAAFLLALAFEQKGNTDREGVNEALRSVATAPGEVILPGEWEKAKKLIAEGKEINYEGAGGDHEFDEAGDVAGAIVEMTIKDGVFVEVGPLE
ncbi:ABC transporter substrate-binding protein [Maritalea mediterranea]|uniref:ABC transporter substrate-binding protein n=1 Tax=Maritalea mediterranea TaxID=2909667 RepID=A0ABS9E918_9HYPH|nr:ABC transporter substrate-binding protein [Maritalea mediterranea]MCF4099379.1 ABC transporter substrate-binding protein [Maritalea mediterranea]